MTKQQRARYSTLIFSAVVLVLAILACFTLSACKPVTESPDVVASRADAQASAEMSFVDELHKYDARIMPDRLCGASAGRMICRYMKAHKRHAGKSDVIPARVVSRFELARIYESGGEQYRVADYILTLISNSGMCG